MSSMAAQHIGRTLVGIVVAALVASGCESTNFNSVQQVGAVVTLVDSGSALSSARIFVLPDTIATIPRTGNALSPAVARELVADIRAHFVALGWIDLRDALAHSAARPDVIVLVAASTQIRTELIYSDWYGTWGALPYWSPSVDPSWGWGVSGEPVAYTYQAGTLVITMLDARAQNDVQKSIPLLWAAGLDGAVGDPSTLARAHAGIDQAFAQSPYLRLK